MKCFMRRFPILFGGMTQLYGFGESAGKYVQIAWSIRWNPAQNYLHKE